MGLRAMLRGAMSEEMERDGFARELGSRDRSLVLFHARWCPFSRAFLPLFEAAEPESSVPFARADLWHPLDARWDDHAIQVVPTLVYFERGEPLERLDGLRGMGITRGDLEEFLEHVEALQEEPPTPRKKKRGLPRNL
jgi:thiol-disulfide isomerase/thioredoxin